MAVNTSLKSVFSSGFSPGFKRLKPSSVEMDQLLCLPLPFMPLKGFSCRIHARWCFYATFFIISMVSILVSTAMLAVQNTGAISC